MLVIYTQLGYVLISEPKFSQKSTPHALYRSFACSLWRRTQSSVTLATPHMQCQTPHNVCTCRLNYNQSYKFIPTCYSSKVAHFNLPNLFECFCFFFVLFCFFFSSAVYVKNFAVSHPVNIGLEGIHTQGKQFIW